MNGVIDAVSKADILVVGIVFYVFNYIMTCLHDIKSNTDKLLDLHEKHFAKNTDSPD